MRIEKTVTAISWIPSEAIEGLPKVPFELGIGHYDEPPPDRLEPGDLPRLRDEDRFREANHLKAWVEVEDRRIVGHGHEGEAYVGWTTLALTIRADCSSEHELVGASAFPRHWVYDDEGRLVQKAGTIDFKTWYRESHGERTPWGEEDAPAVVTAAESDLERQLSANIMRGGVAPGRRRVATGETLVEQGERGDELYLLLDGVLGVEIDGEPVAEVGPGALVGERALLEGGTRKATLRAATPCSVPVVPGDAVDRDALEELAEGRR